MLLYSPLRAYRVTADPVSRTENTPYVADYHTSATSSNAGRRRLRSVPKGRTWELSPSHRAAYCWYRGHVLKPAHHVKVEAPWEEDVGAVLYGGAFGGAGHVVYF